MIIKGVKFILLWAVLLTMLSAGYKEGSPLSPIHKKWLEEDVSYIITQKEKSVFLQLNTDRERNLFIDAFWKQRDPLPLTNQNEYKDEHYRRLQYANTVLKRGTPIPGWKTDRGRIYIILGPPENERSYEGQSSVYPTIVWFYQGMSKYGLPDAFNIVFFKRNGTGDYRIFSPTLDGPQSLLAHMPITQTNLQAAYRELLHLSPELGRVSRSLIPGESLSGGSGSLASDKLLSDIHSIPNRTQKDDYAEKLLMYKDRIEVEYSANYISNASQVSIIQDQSGIFFVNYIVEPERLGFEHNLGKYFTKIQASGTLSDREGNTIYQFEKSSDLQLDNEQYDRIRSMKYRFQDAFPVVEGDFVFNLLIKNEASKEFTSIEKDINIPKSSEMKIGDLILAYKVEKQLPLEIHKAFKIGDRQFFPSLNNGFTSSDTLVVFFQIFGLQEQHRRDGEIHVEIHNQDNILVSREMKISEVETSGFFLEEFPLRDFPPAYYVAEVSLTDNTGATILSRENQLMISPADSLPRPWINSAILPPSRDPVYLNILGNQYLNLRNMDRAKTLLEKAYLMNPDQIHFALSYSDVLFKQTQYSEIIKVLSPFLKENQPAVLEMLARSCHVTGNYTQAISYYESHIGYYGITFPVLTLMGDCYYRLGNTEEALKAWEKSLEINPDQEKIKKLVDTLKKQKISF